MLFHSNSGIETHRDECQIPGLHSLPLASNAQHLRAFPYSKATQVPKESSPHGLLCLSCPGMLHDPYETMPMALKMEPPASPPAPYEALPMGV